MRKFVIVVLSLFLIGAIGIAADTATKGVTLKDKVVVKIKEAPVSKAVEKTVVVVKTVEKKVETTIATVVTAVLTEADWRSARDLADTLQGEGKLLEASAQHLKTVEIARQLKDGFSNSRSAWGLQNAGYMVVLMHQKDNKTDLTKADAYLREASNIISTIPDANPDCIKCINSNLDYVTRNMPKQVEKKIEQPVKSDKKVEKK